MAGSGDTTWQAAPRASASTVHLPAAPSAADAARWLAVCPVALAGADPHGRLSWANTACQALLPGLRKDVSLVAQLGLDGPAAGRLEGVLQAGGETDLAIVREGIGVHWLRAKVQVVEPGARLVWLNPVDRLHWADTELERLNGLLELACNMGQIGVFERDVVTGRGRWDARMFRTRGLDGEGEAPGFDAAAGEIVDADREAFNDTVRRSLLPAPGVPQRQHWRARYRIRGQDGVVRQLHKQWFVQHGADGQPLRMVGLVMDDSEALAMRRMHDETAWQLALAADLAGLASWRHDLASDTVLLNAQAFAVLDVAPRPGVVPIGELRDRIHPGDMPMIAAATAQAQANGRPIDQELRVRWRNGEWRTLMARRVLQRDAAGQPQAFIGVAIDLTERIDASRRAAELGRRFALATQAAGIGYWSTDGRRIDWNPELRTIHGIAPGAPLPGLRRWLNACVDRADRHALLAQVRTWLAAGRSAGNALQIDCRIRRPGGEQRQLVTHTVVEACGGAAGNLFGLVFDVTERRRAERALREADQRTALAVRGAGLGAWEIDPADGAIHWDAQMWRLHGLQPPPARPLSLAQRLAMVHPGDHAAVRGQHAAALRGDESTDVEFRVLRPDGQVRWLASHGAAVHDAQGQLLRRIGVDRDITDQRIADAANRERERAVQESQAKSRFLARMSHELRTPLNAVLGFTHLMLHEDADARAGDDAAARTRRTRTAHIQTAGRHLLDLINDALDLSSLEGGDIPLLLRPVALAPLLAETLPLLDPLLREHDVALLRGDVDAVARADRTRLRQVVLNVLSNAIKYNHPGGWVRIDARQAPDGRVVLQVADSGRGMTALQLQHLFEPFNRLGAEREGIPGTGIGLTIVKTLMERMDGSVEVGSEPGGGSVFELRLPASDTARDAPAAAATSRAGAGAPAPGRAILYIEDDPVNATIVSELIQPRGDLQLHVAPTGGLGLQMAALLRPALILLDMQLPDMSGLDVLARLRDSADTAATPVIALSANAMRADIAFARAAGVDDYWLKPLDFDTFAAAIEARFGAAPA